jgi:hypothetical protein
MHYSVAVIHKESQTVEELLAPFNENLEVHWTKSREEHIKGVREDIEHYKQGPYYTQYLKDKEGYLDQSSERHGNYISKEFPKKLTWTDEECYTEATEYYGESKINIDGSTTETSNPDGQWDWYKIGGRWSNTLKTKQGINVDTCTLDDLALDVELSTYALLLNGKWEKLDGDLITKIEDLPKDLHITIVDIHR